MSLNVMKVTFINRTSILVFLVILTVLLVANYLRTFVQNAWLQHPIYIMTDV